MSLLTIIGLLPLVISILIVAIPGKNIGLIKKVAFGGTTVIAIISILLATGLISQIHHFSMCKVMLGFLPLILITQ